MTKRNLVAVAVLGAAAVGVAAVAQHTGPGPDLAPVAAARVLEVETLAVRTESGYRLVQAYTGELRARRQAGLGLEVGGRIVSIHADVGARVGAGDLLVELDAAHLLASRDELDAGLRAARAALAELEAGPRAETIAAARALRDQRREERRLADLQLERRRALVERAVDSQADLDVAETNLRTADARLAEADARLAELEAGTRAEVLDAQRARVAELQAGLQRIAAALDDTLLRAPFDGVIAARDADEGAVVAAGDVVLRIVETDRIEAWIGVPEDVATRCGDADALRVEVDGRTVAVGPPRALPELDRRTRTATLVFDLDAGAGPRPRPGAIARLLVEQHTDARGFWLPLEALVPGARGLWSCRVLTPAGDGEAIVRRAALELLHVDGERAFVRGTLQDGDAVLASGVQRVVAGQRVRPVPTSETER
ncbi:MAG: HlyD family efflux transporter periplasmic adaptor subunit [Planctomycetes bacterium]|nr:HlyD family efflux transporter periplasmic adaptor subunit [Planctomycetota bacterium]